MIVLEFETEVWALVGIRIVIRAPENEPVEPYAHESADRDGRTFAIFLTTRVQPMIGDKEVTVIDGSGHPAHPATQLGTVRRSYPQR